VWPAAILLGQWVAQMASREGVVDSMRDKVVLELGAGCGLPAIVAGNDRAVDLSSLAFTNP
jgi:predicted nicotinamide N-methyase